MIKMTALTVFHSHAIRTARGDGVAQTGETFETADVQYAKDLRRAGLAEAERNADLDGEPAPAVALSEPFGAAEPAILAPVAAAPAKVPSASRRTN